MGSKSELTDIRNGIEGVRILQESVADLNKIDYEGVVDRYPIGI